MVDAACSCRGHPPDAAGPVARQKKGEFVELFEQMQAQGYVRFRVDGRIYEVDDLPELKKTEKHDIDVVVDA